MNDPITTAVTLVQSERDRVVAFIARVQTRRTSFVTFGFTAATAMVGFADGRQRVPLAAGAALIVLLAAYQDRSQHLLLRALMAQERRLEMALNAHFKSLTRDAAQEHNQRMVRRNLDSVELGVQGVLQPWPFRKVIDPRGWDWQSVALVLLSAALTGIAAVSGVAAEEAADVCVEGPDGTVFRVHETPELLDGPGLSIRQCPTSSGTSRDDARVEDG